MSRPSLKIIRSRLPAANGSYQEGQRYGGGGGHPFSSSVGGRVEIEMAGSSRSRELNYGTVDLVGSTKKMTGDDMVVESEPSLSSEVFLHGLDDPTSRNFESDDSAQPLPMKNHDVVAPNLPAIINCFDEPQVVEVSFDNVEGLTVLNKAANEYKVNNGKFSHDSIVCLEWTYGAIFKAAMKLYEEGNITILRDCMARIVTRVVGNKGHVYWISPGSKSCQCLWFKMGDIHRNQDRSQTHLFCKHLIGAHFALAIGNVKYYCAAMIHEIDSAYKQMSESESDLGWNWTQDD